jgi:hypothetical protein
VSGSFYFFGGIAMTIAGICEFILGNTFPFVVFLVYGAHWVNLGYTADPLHGIVSSYGGAAGALLCCYGASDVHLPVWKSEDECALRDRLFLSRVPVLVCGGGVLFIGI